MEIFCPECGDEDYNGKHCFECGFPHDDKYPDFDDIDLWEIDKEEFINSNEYEDFKNGK